MVVVVVVSIVVVVVASVVVVVASVVVVVVVDGVIVVVVVASIVVVVGASVVVVTSLRSRSRLASTALFVSWIAITSSSLPRDTITSKVASSGRATVTFPLRKISSSPITLLDE